MRLLSARKTEDALRYAWSLPVSSVLVGCDTSALLRKTLKSAARFEAFQRAQGLTVDGVVGPLTIMQLNRVSAVAEPRLSGER